LIRKYKTRVYKSKHFRTKLRNEIHGLMHAKVLGYVKGVLAKWHRYEDEPKLISLSWDAFMFCLDRYDDEKYDIYGHFNTYVRYFLLLHYGKEDRGLDREVFMDDVRDVIPTLKTGDPAAVLAKLTELKSFRDSLVQEHQRKIFDHVVVGDHEEMFANLKSERGGISCYRYYKSYGMKEAFQAIVDHILGEGKE
ncbi:unnamed protein product, partial [marine sediment metagenome]